MKTDNARIVALWVNGMGAKRLWRWKSRRTTRIEVQDGNVGAWIDIAANFFRFHLIVFTMEALGISACTHYHKRESWSRWKMWATRQCLMPFGNSVLAIKRSLLQIGGRGNLCVPCKVRDQSWWMWSRSSRQRRQEILNHGRQECWFRSLISVILTWRNLRRLLLVGKFGKGSGADGNHEAI